MPAPFKERYRIMQRLISRLGSLWHFAIIGAELAALTVLYNPTHPKTPGVIAQVAASIDVRPAHRILTPDRDTWRKAGMLAGLLARLQLRQK
jgi:hypothetical protein